jgi:hypothetical protein
MQWDATATGGFSGGRPWLPPLDPAVRNAADQAGDEDSMLNLVRRLIDLRRGITGTAALVAAPAGILTFDRDEHRIIINAGARPSKIDVGDRTELMLASGTGVVRPAAASIELEGHAAAVLRRG